MWKKTEDEQPHPYATPTPAPTPRTPDARRSGSRAVIGESIRVEGDIRGEEDLLVEGEVEGKIMLAKHSVTVGRGGRVKADIHGRNISVEGMVQGNLFADEQVVVRESGEVRGNITAPRVSLEDGAKFKGAIDMEPKRAEKGVAAVPVAAPTSQRAMDLGTDAVGLPVGESAAGAPSAGAKAAGDNASGSGAKAGASA